MTLREFLAERARDSSGPAADRLQIIEFSDAVTSLIKRFKDVLGPYEKMQALEVEEWVPLLKERWIPYNAPALAVRLRDDEILIEPVGTFVLGAQGRVAMTRGMRKVHLDWGGNDDWTYRWVRPRETEPTPLTETAIEELVMGLLA